MKKIFIITSLFLFIPSISFATLDTNLSFGSRGQAVIDLQNMLISKGFLKTNASGSFYTLTKQAVIAYQASFGLPNTGFVGPMTRQKINTELSSRITPPTASEQTISKPAAVSSGSVGATITPVLNSTNQTPSSPSTSIPVPVPDSVSTVSNPKAIYIVEKTSFGPIIYLSTMDPVTKARFFGDAQKLAEQAEKDGTLSFKPLPSTEPQPNIEAMRDMCTERPNLFFQADKSDNVSEVLFRASYRASCAIDPDMKWSFSDGNPSDAKSGTLGDGTWVFARGNFSAAYNIAYYFFSGAYPNIDTFTFTIGTTTVTAVVQYHHANSR